MRMGSLTHGPVVRETLLALLVLALTFLNFGHSSAVFAAGGRVVVTGTSICGDQNPTSAGDHFACHACRQDVAGLPPPDVAFCQVTYGEVPPDYAETAVSSATAPAIGAPRPRGPPAV